MRAAIRSVGRGHTNSVVDDAAIVATMVVVAMIAAEEYVELTATAVPTAHKENNRANGN
jgi:hypothetical protein